MPIDSVESLQGHLRLAGQVELTTIPTYLYAMYSLDDPASDAAKLIRSVVVEEMLHLALVGNLLLATGAEPNFYDPDFVPAFPTLLPHHVPDLEVRLEPCSVDLIRSLFMVIEQPAAPDAQAEPDQFETLGQFYAAIEAAIQDLDPFDAPQLDRQMADPAFYFAVKYDSQTSGGLVGIDGLDAALLAIDTIMHQGEGLGDHKYADPDHRELTHFFKFELIANGEVPLGSTRAVPVNPRVADYPTDIQPVAELANALYSFVLLLLDEIFEAGADQGELIGDLYGTMSGLLTPVAHYLTTLPIASDAVAAPTFEFHQFGPSPRAEIGEMATALLDDHPDLEPTIHQIEKRWLH